MIKNYLTISIRNLLKNKFYLFINVTGLGLALSTCIVAYLNTQFALEFDQQHENGDRIYRVQFRKDAQNDMVEYGMNPLPLGPAAGEEITDIITEVRYTNPDYVVQRDETVLHKEIGFADPEFLEMFNYPLRVGDESAFADKKNILLSAEMAEVYFGEEDPMGQILTIRNNEDEAFPFIVAGVFEKIPRSSSIYFDALLPFDNYYEINSIERNNWRAFIGATFFLIETQEKARNVEALLDNYIEIQNKAADDFKVAQYYLVPFWESGNQLNLLANWLDTGLHPAAYASPPIMAILILLIACFNFTNTSIAMASNRVKEIGIRKVMGGGRIQLILQFMGENILVCLMAMIVAVALANYLVPAYSAMWPNLELNAEFSANLGLYGFLSSLLLFTSIVAGAYPSIYVSSFKPVTILQGRLRIGSSGKLSRFLLGAQYFFTVMALFSGFAFLQNSWYQETLDLGFNRDTIIGAQIANHTDYLKLKSRLEENPNFSGVTGSEEHIGRWDYSRTLENEGVKIESFMLDFGPGYIETMDVDVLSGRSFTEELKESDEKQSIIVNQELVKMFGWDEPLGKRVAIDDSTTLTVIGVVRNFYHNGFWRGPRPYGIRLADEESYNFIVAKVPENKLTESYRYLEEKWAEVIPNKPFGGFYQDELSTKQAMDTNKNIVVTFGFMAIISVILSGIGLFTLVSLNIIRRTKEIGIRKVLGARIGGIVNLMNRPFLIMIVLGGTLGSVFGYYLVDMMMGSIYELHKEVDMVTFLFPIGTILIISLATSSLRILFAALRNPVEALRYE